MDSTVAFLFPDRAHYIVQDIPSAARSHHGTAEVAEDGCIGLQPFGLQPEKLCIIITFRTWPSRTPKDSLLQEGTTTTPDYFEKTM